MSYIQKKEGKPFGNPSQWAMRGSNPRPPRCKRGALNQLS